MQNEQLNKFYNDPKHRAISRKLALNYILNSETYNYLFRKAELNKDFTGEEDSLVLELAIKAVISQTLLDQYEKGHSTDQISKKYNFFTASTGVEMWTVALFDKSSTDLIKILKGRLLRSIVSGKFGINI